MCPDPSSEGYDLVADVSVEEVRDNWGKISDPEGQKAYVAGGEQGAKFFRKMAGG